MTRNLVSDVQDPEKKVRKMQTKRIWADIVDLVNIVGASMLPAVSCQLARNEDLDIKSEPHREFPFCEVAFFRILNSNDDVNILSPLQSGSRRQSIN